MIAIILVSIMSVFQWYNTKTILYQVKYLKQNLKNINNKYIVDYCALGIGIATYVYPILKPYRTQCIKKIKMLYSYNEEIYDFWIVSKQITLAVVFIVIALLMIDVNKIVSGLIILLSIIFVWQQQYHIKLKLNSYNEQMIMALPIVLSELILLLNAGQTLQQSWEKVAFSNCGPLYDDMQCIVLHSKNGSSFVEQLMILSKHNLQITIKKFTTICLQASQKGSVESVKLLENMLEDSWIKQKNMLLQKAQSTNQNLLIPGAIIFLGIIIIIIGPVFLNGFM